MTVDGRVLKTLEASLGSDHVRTDADSLAHYGRDFCDMFEAAPSAIVFPGSTDEVVRIVHLANERKFALVPSGGRTGLSAGATATNGEIVVSLERMNRVLGIDTVSRTIRCQAGVVTANVQDKAAEKGLFYPVDFASSGSSHIGGNIATNAGGINVIRYGMTRQWVAGLEVVTGRGEVLNLNRGLLKNNSGYDLRQVFIGSEGTLGIITEATLWLTNPPKESVVMVLGVAELSALMPVLEKFQSSLVISGFEYFPEESLKRVVAAQDLQRPFETRVPFYALIDFECASGADESAATRAFEQCLENGWVLDGVMSQSGEQSEKLWKLRELIADSLAKWTPLHTDVSVTVSNVPNFLEELEQALERHAGEYTTICFGHVGDGNVHVSILKPDEMDKAEFEELCTGAVERIYEVVGRFGGTISAEHGVALLKKPYLHTTRSREEIDLMKSIKSVFDPNGVMNPGKIFDPA